MFSNFPRPLPRETMSVAIDVQPIQPVVAEVREDSLKSVVPPPRPSQAVCPLSRRLTPTYPCRWRQSRLTPIYPCQWRRHFSAEEARRIVIEMKYLVGAYENDIPGLITLFS